MKIPITCDVETKSNFNDKNEEIRTERIFSQFSEFKKRLNNLKWNGNQFVQKEIQETRIGDEPVEKLITYSGILSNDGRSLMNFSFRSELYHLLWGRS